MKEIDLNIRTDDLNVSGIVSDDSIPLRVEPRGEQFVIVKQISIAPTIEQAQAIALDLQRKKEGWELSKETIMTALDLTEQEVDPKTGQPKRSKTAAKRKLGKIQDALDQMKDGVLILEDDHWEFLKRIFSTVDWGRGGWKQIPRVEDHLSKPIEKPEGKPAEAPSK